VFELALRIANSKNGRRCLRQLATTPQTTSCTAIRGRWITSNLRHKALRDSCNTCTRALVDNHWSAPAQRYCGSCASVINELSMGSGIRRSLACESLSGTCMPPRINLSCILAHRPTTQNCVFGSHHCWRYFKASSHTAERRPSSCN